MTFVAMASGNEILDKIGYNSACIRAISEMVASNREWDILSKPLA